MDISAFARLNWRARMNVSRRMSEVQSPIIPTVAGWIRANPGTISLGQGVVFYGPPPQTMEQIGRFEADPDNHKYKLVDGIPPLREAIAQKLSQDNGIRLGPENALVVTAGGNMAFMNAVLAIADPGDEIILPSPYYFNHEMAITMASCRPVLVPTDSRHLPQIESIRAALTPRTRAVVTVSPNNPSGAVYPEPLLREINRLCAERGIFHISDEAYEYFVHDGAKHFSPASVSGSEAHTISIFSLSKSHGFASWRIGWMVAPTGLLEAIKKAQDTILICPAVIAQFAAIGALQAGGDYCRQHMQSLAETRRIAREQFGQIEDICEVPPASGAFYYLLRLRSQAPALSLVERLVREHRVAAIPGSAFGLDDGCHLRVAYGALARDTAAEGLARLTRGLRALLSP